LSARNDIAPATGRSRIIETEVSSQPRRGGAKGVTHPESRQDAEHPLAFNAGQSFDYVGCPPAIPVDGELRCQGQRAQSEFVTAPDTEAETKVEQVACVADDLGSEGADTDAHAAAVVFERRWSAQCWSSLGYRVRYRPRPLGLALGRGDPR